MLSNSEFTMTKSDIEAKLAEIEVKRKQLKEEEERLNVVLRDIQLAEELSQKPSVKEIGKEISRFLEGEIKISGFATYVEDNEISDQKLLLSFLADNKHESRRFQVSELVDLIEAFRERSTCVRTMGPLKVFRKDNFDEFKFYDSVDNKYAKRLEVLKKRLNRARADDEE